MFPIDRASVLLRAFPRNRRSRSGANPPRPVGPPLQGGDRKNSPPWRGAASAAGWVPPARQTTPSASHLTHFTRFLTCRRGVVALESALAVIPLIICLVGVFEIVQSVFVRDLLQRAVYQTAYENALYDGAASNAAELLTRYRNALNGEVGGLLSFALDGEGACSETPPADSPAVDFCLKVCITAYDSPSDIPSDGPQSCDAAKRGGNAGDIVVVTVVATSQSALSELQQGFFGDNGMMVTAVRRNELEAA